MCDVWKAVCGPGKRHSTLSGAREHSQSRISELTANEVRLPHSVAYTRCAIKAAAVPRGKVRSRIAKRWSQLGVGLSAPALSTPLGAREWRRLPDPIRSATRLHAAVVIMLVAAAALTPERTGGERQRRSLLREEAP